ncbi:MAG: DNA repair protein RecO (recombination protein O) [Algoriphagus sp.]|jgi:DNA repair protein RecO (recombination protein O)
MLKKTSGIVLNVIKFKETSLIVKIFTRELGLKSYLINGVRTQSKSSKMALYQPLTCLDMVVYDKTNAGLNRISEARLSHNNQLISFEFSRTGIALFVTEVIAKSIYENYQNESLFDFLESSVHELNHPEAKLDLFPLAFLIELAGYLGFAPERAQGYLDESRSQPFTPQELNDVRFFLEDLMLKAYSCDQKINLKLRRKLLDHLLDFYSEHLENPGVWKSMTILRQVLS